MLSKETFTKVGSKFCVFTFNLYVIQFAAEPRSKRYVLCGNNIAELKH